MAEMGPAVKSVCDACNDALLKVTRCCKLDNSGAACDQSVDERRPGVN